MNTIKRVQNRKLYESKIYIVLVYIVNMFWGCFSNENYFVSLSLNELN